MFFSRNPEPEKKRKKITVEDVHAMQYKVLEKQCLKLDLQTELLLKLLKNSDALETNALALVSVLSSTL